MSPYQVSRWEGGVSRGGIEDEKGGEGRGGERREG